MNQMWLENRNSGKGGGVEKGWNISVLSWLTNSTRWSTKVISIRHFEKISEAWMRILQINKYNSYNNPLKTCSLGQDWWILRGTMTGLRSFVQKEFAQTKYSYRLRAEFWPQLIEICRQRHLTLDSHTVTKMNRQYSYCRFYVMFVPLLWTLPPP